jgi:hypothetical protein
MGGFWVSFLSFSVASVRKPIVNGYVAAGWSLFMIAESAVKSRQNNYSKLANFVGGLKLERFL